MHVVLNQAIDSYRRDKFLEEANEAYASLRSNANAWKAEQDERDLWDHTSGDGLEHE